MIDHTAAALAERGHLWLRRRNPTASIVHEFSVAPWGHAVVDIAAITDDYIEAIEIKGDGDDCTRLERQGWWYSRCCQRVWLLTAPSLTANAIKHRPRGWGHLVVQHPDERPGLRELMRPENLHEHAHALTSICWVRELRQIAKALGVRNYSGETRPVLAARLGRADAAVVSAPGGVFAATPSRLDTSIRSSGEGGSATGSCHNHVYNCGSANMSDHIGTAPMYSDPYVAERLGVGRRRVGTTYFYKKDFPACAHVKGFRWRNRNIRDEMLNDGDQK